MAVVVGFSDGNLTISGDADGHVEVTSERHWMGSSYRHDLTVTDNGVELGTYQSYGGNIRVSLDQDGPGQDDSVVINLGVNDDMENINVDLGNGNNSFQIRDNGLGFSGVQVDRIIYQGGSGNDVVRFDMVANLMARAELGHGDDDFRVGCNQGRLRVVGGAGHDSFVTGERAHLGPTIAILGPGNDSAHLAARSYSTTSIWAGAGEDDVTLAADTHVGDLFVHLGQDNNVANLYGGVFGALRIRGGEGADQISLDSGYVTGFTSILMGDGDNHLNLGCHFNGDSMVYVRGGAGNDQVELTEDFESAGDFWSALGHGDNTLDSLGDIDGFMTAVSFNSDDLFSNDGYVGGRLWLKPGGQRGG